MKEKFFLAVIFIVMTFISAACSAESAENTPPTAEKNQVADKAVPVEVMTIAKKPVEQVIEYTGRVEANNSVDIIAEVTGDIVEIKKELGEYVKKDEPLAIIDYDVALANYKQAQSEVLSAENNLMIAKKNFESDKILFEAGDISQLEFDNSELAAKNAEAQLLGAKAQLSLAKKTYEDTHLKSPINGFVSRKFVNKGSMVSNGTPVYRVVDLSEIKVTVGVPQNVISRIKKNAKAVLTFASLNNKKFEGIVKHISPQSDEQTGSFNVEIHVKNTADRLIKAGMTSSIKLFLTDPQEYITVPDYAVVYKNENPHLYLVENGVAKLVPVKLNGAYGQDIVILEGVKVGDKIVNVGMENLGVETVVIVDK